MTNRTLGYVCRSIATYDKQGRFDDVAFREYLQRFIEPKIGVYVASSGSAIGQALTWDELGRMYRAAVEVCKGKIPIGANIPEQYTAKLSLAHAQLAAENGVDIVNIYGPDGRHGFRPTGAEYTTYFDRILAELSYPVSLCPNSTLGYMPTASVIAEIANKYPQVQNVVLTGVRGDEQFSYFINLKEALKRDVDIYVTMAGSMNAFGLGAVGVAGNEPPNVLPKTTRQYLDAYSGGDLEAAAHAYRDIERMVQFTEQWTGGKPRWLIMFLKAFKLPGGEGVLPDPFLKYADAEYERFTKGMLELNIPEINEMALAAGLKTAH